MRLKILRKDNRCLVRNYIYYAPSGLKKKRSIRLFYGQSHHTNKIKDSYETSLKNGLFRETVKKVVSEFSQEIHQHLDQCSEFFQAQLRKKIRATLMNAYLG